MSHAGLLPSTEYCETILTSFSDCCVDQRADGCAKRQRGQGFVHCSISSVWSTGCLQRSSGHRAFSVLLTATLLRAEAAAFSSFFAAAQGQNIRDGHGH